MRMVLGETVGMVVMTAFLAIVLAVFLVAGFAVVLAAAGFGTERLVEAQHFLHLAGAEVLAELLVVLLLEVGKVLEACETLFGDAVEFLVRQLLAGLEVLFGCALAEQFVEFAGILTISDGELLRLLVGEHQFVRQTLDIELHAFLLGQLLAFAALFLLLLCADVSHEEGT